MPVCELLHPQGKVFEGPEFVGPHANLIEGIYTGTDMTEEDRDAVYQQLVEDALLKKLPLPKQITSQKVRKGALTLIAVQQSIFY